MVRGETDNTCTKVEAVEHSYFNKKLRIMFQVSKIPKQPTRKVAPDVCSKFPTHPSAWFMKLHAISVNSKTTISQCVDQSQIWQQYKQILSTRNPSWA